MPRKPPPPPFAVPPEEVARIDRERRANRQGHITSAAERRRRAQIPGFAWLRCCATAPSPHACAELALCPPARPTRPLASLLPHDGRTCEGGAIPWASPRLLPELLDRISSAGDVASMAARMLAQQADPPEHAPTMVAAARVLNALAWAARAGDRAFLDALSTAAARYLDQHQGESLTHPSRCAGGYRYLTAEDPVPARTRQLQELRDDLLAGLECGRAGRRQNNRLQSPDDLAATFVVRLQHLDGGELASELAAVGLIPLATAEGPTSDDDIDDDTDDEGGGLAWTRDARGRQGKAWAAKVAAAFATELERIALFQGEAAIPTRTTATLLTWKALEAIGIEGARHFFSFESKGYDA